MFRSARRQFFIWISIGSMAAFPSTASSRAKSTNRLSTLSIKVEELRVSDGRTTVIARDRVGRAFKMVHTETLVQNGRLKSTYLFQPRHSRYLLVDQSFSPHETLHFKEVCFPERSSWDKLIRVRVDPQMQPEAFVQSYRDSIDASCSTGRFERFASSLESSIRRIDTRFNELRDGLTEVMGNTDRDIPVGRLHDCIMEKYDPIVAVKLDEQMKALGSGSSRSVIECSNGRSSNRSPASYGEARDRITFTRPVSGNLDEVLTHEILHRAGVRNHDDLARVQGCCLDRDPNACGALRRNHDGELYVLLQQLSSDPFSMRVLTELADQESPLLREVAERLSRRQLEQDREGQTIASSLDARARSAIAECGVLPQTRQEPCRREILRTKERFETAAGVGLANAKVELSTEPVVLDIDGPYDLREITRDADFMQAKVAEIENREEAEAITASIARPSPAPSGFVATGATISYSNPSASADYVATREQRRTSILSGATSAATWARDARSGRTAPAPTRAPTRAERRSRPPTRVSRASLAPLQEKGSASLAPPPRLLGFPVAVMATASKVLAAEPTSPPPTSATLASSGDSRRSVREDEVAPSRRIASVTSSAGGSGSTSTERGASVSRTSITTVTTNSEAPARSASASYTEDQALQDALTSYAAVSPALADPEKREVLVRALRRRNVELVPLEGTSLGALEPAAQLVYRRGRPDLPPRRVPVSRR